MGRFLTNNENDCSLSVASMCVKHPMYVSFSQVKSTYHCVKHQPLAYWIDKEIGPSAPTTSGAILANYTGIYEKQPGPIGSWAPGYGDPQKIGLPNKIGNTSIFFPSNPPIQNIPPKSFSIPLPSINAPLPKTWGASPQAPYQTVTAHSVGLTGNSVGGNVGKLKAIREDEVATSTMKSDPAALLEPIGCKACGSQEKSRHRLMCPQDPARKKKA